MDFLAAVTELRYCEKLQKVHSIFSQLCHFLGSIPPRQLIFYIQPLKKVFSGYLMKNHYNVLITGAEHKERLDYAYKLIKDWLCSSSTDKACEQCQNCQRDLALNPNVISIEPTNNKETGGDLGTIKIDQVRQIITENHKANFENGLGIFLITHMHQATQSAANALLKAIEENHKNKIFIALAPSRMTVLPTIASRMICHVVEPAPLPDNCNPTLKDKIFNLSKLSPKDRFLLCSGFSSDKDSLMGEIEELINACHILLRQNQIPARFALALSSALSRTQILLKKNVNPRLAVEQLVLNEWPQGL